MKEQELEDLLRKHVMINERSVELRVLNAMKELIEIINNHKCSCNKK